MARDPPSLLASSELRDLPLRPTHVEDARIAIIHPQLRDLILPLERGRVLHPRNNSIEEVKWKFVEGIYTGNGRRDGTEDEDVSMDAGEGLAGDDAASKGATSMSSTRLFAKLNFTPNCLTASRGVLAAGGQHGEMYICDLLSKTDGLHNFSLLRPPQPQRPFHLSQTLPTRSINNSILILPSYPDAWRAQSEVNRLGYVGRGNRCWEEDEGDLGAKMEKGEWIRQSWQRNQVDEEEEDDDEAMDIDDDEDEELEAPRSPATYPNTVPFLHAPRIPNLPASPPYTHARRPSNSPPMRFRSDVRASRQSFSAYTPSTQPVIQIVSSLPHSSRSSSTSLAVRPSPPVRPASHNTDSRTLEGRSHQFDEPRILISNNDQTVKVFSLRPTLPTPSSSNESPQPSTQQSPSTWGRTQRQILAARAARSAPQPLPPPPTFFGGAMGWESVGLNAGIRSNSNAAPDSTTTHQAQPRDDYASVTADMSSAHRRHWRSFVDSSSGAGGGGSSGSIGGLGAGHRDSAMRTMSLEAEERRLSRIGGARFKYAINHSAVSPDLRTLVSVGDSTDVYLFEIIDGGRDFRKIRTYSAATDSGFSTAWSKDGRKFAVASQDGQVTVWDHRSSHPLAIFHTSSEPPSHSHTTMQPPRSSSPSFADDLAQAYIGSGGTATQVLLEELAREREWRAEMAMSNERAADMVLVDPITGDAHPGGSSSGREAARVVKFSPEGSERDLMVFSEENSNIHIVDAKTFHSRVILPVPTGPAGTRQLSPFRTGVEGGTWGIAGVAFDPTGNWLYAGTERTVVEWDVRRLGGGEGGCWGMA